MASRISLSIPYLAGNEGAYVADCMATGWISSVGAYVNRFDEEFAQYIGEETSALATASGTAALHLALLVSGIKPGDEVIAPALTFIAPINAITYIGATPTFVDCSAESLGICPQAVQNFIDEHCDEHDGRLVNRQTGKPVTAILPVHVLGHACHIDELLTIAKRYNLILIEDAAEGVGCTYRGRHVGTFGQSGCFSFNGNKTLSTGGGGMVISQNPEHLERMRHLALQAKLDGLTYHHDAIGYNYRMPNVHAAIGVGQLEHLPEMLARKRAIYTRYVEHLATCPTLSLFAEADWCQYNCWMTLILLPAGSRDAALQAFREASIETRPLWELNPRQPMYSHHPCGPIPVATDMHARGLCIPSHPGMSNDDVDRVLTVLDQLAAT